MNCASFCTPVKKLSPSAPKAEEKAYSDRAIISLVITSEDKQLSTSISNNIALRESISQQLVTAGINPDHIKSSKFSTSPQYGWFGKKPDSYKVVNRMAVTITRRVSTQDHRQCRRQQRTDRAVRYRL